MPEIEDFCASILSRYQSIFCTYNSEKITKTYKMYYENTNLSYFENKKSHFSVKRPIK